MPYIEKITFSKTSPQIEGEIIDISVIAKDPENDQIFYKIALDNDFISEWGQLFSWKWDTSISGAANHIIKADVKDKYHDMSSKKDSEYIIDSPPIDIDSHPMDTDSYLIGTGDVRVTLNWSDRADIDLHVIDPDGEEIYYDNSISSSGGILDIDNRCGNFEWEKPENIYWPNGEAPIGSYKVSVVYYSDCNEAGPVKWYVEIYVDGDTKTYSGTLNSEKDMQDVITFEND